jgi:two-component system nitrate/nitrite response regulator NarL
VRLVLCDDHLLLLEALKPALELHGHTVLAAVTTPEEAVAAVVEHRPDVLLLDVFFPDGDSGLRVVTEVAAASPQTRVVFLSGGSDPELVRAAVEAGAVGFTRKGLDLGGILSVLNRVMAGEIVIDPALLRAAVGHRQEQQDHDIRWLAGFLTGREKEVLDHIVAGDNTTQMAEAMGIARSTARTHVQSVLSKLGVHSRLQAATAMFAASSPDRSLPDRSGPDNSPRSAL